MRNRDQDRRKKKKRRVWPRRSPCSVHFGKTIYTSRRFAFNAGLKRPKKCRSCSCFYKK